MSLFQREGFLPLVTALSVLSLIRQRRAPDPFYIMEYAGSEFNPKKLFTITAEIVANSAQHLLKFHRLMPKFKSVKKASLLRKELKNLMVSIRVPIY